ncbi:hypothetical protein [Actinoplanes utahensis]|uniref:Uncharacterized protein n=1 Tax=Actinoplanes utahensis TaxID=1869 RepID=A0A0A6UWQ5_ACTUT|nr:hypothetical protein [Actinoplanes utahensis]KHD78839.1 hypothetical protein MB27_01625 [Actinoplanes utahensis]GIF28222.1 hypothetical protein Aut01nite_12080 [Actinoplanes utahensis]
MRRLLLWALAVAGTVLVPATPASAHVGDTASVSDYRITVTGLSSPMDGLTVRVVEGGARLELSNTTGRTIEVLGYSGEPYLEVRPDGAYENVNSPATYVNETLGGETPVPPAANPTSAPSWRRISGDTTVRWHDQRILWTEAGPPPVAAAAPDQRHRLREWAVPLRDQVRTFDIQGTLDYEPPPRAWAWWTGAALLGLAVTVLASRWPRSAGPLAVAGGLTTLGYVVTTVLDGGGWAGVPIVAGLLACAAAYRPPPFFLTLAGFVLAAFAGFGSADVFFAAVVPSAGPGWFPRVAVAVAIGAGAGLALTGVLRLRAAVPTPAPEPAPAQPVP